uniref:GPI ethanolamine phosphate transferase 2 C-terminal domain-containing protein n=1 Tax=Trichobilharzia regenti TaxID=157069 RepID=A0AA85J3F7_TRIRE|nr:unnamed protein product [Trichobilharzia regenti]
MGFLEKINIYECLVLIGVYSFGLFVFMNGLLPNDPVIKVGEINQLEEIKKVDKLVLMVIDALRADFLFSSNYSEYWTKLNSYMNLKSATCSISTVQPPTVTLPRIKAIVSGRAPKFVDVLNNINAGAMADDNWVNRLAKLQWNLRFYGDDTWIKLFPKSFQDYDGTNSFYVNDFHEVDTNVTRHISTLMNSSTTWDGLILHYLGLDHIGHTQGPNGRSMPDKIREMDEVVHSILDPMINSPAFADKKWLFILTGDHGMSDQGSHGGSTIGEKSVGLFMLGSNWNKTYQSLKRSCSNNTKHIEQTQQVDLASLIGLITGAGIPSRSLGVLSSTWLNNLWLSNEEKLKTILVLMRHIGQVIGECKSSGTTEDTDCTSSVWSKEQVVKYNVLLHEINSWLQCQSAKTEALAKLKHIDCREAGSRVKGELLVTDSTKLLHDVQSESLSKVEHLNNTQMLFGGILMWFVTIFLFHKILNSVVFTSDIKNSLLNKRNQKSLIQYYYSDTADIRYSFDPRLVQIICSFGTVCLLLHSISLASSSYAEEEHQLWYYFGSSLMLLIGLLVLLGDVTSNIKWIIIKLILKILLLDRFLLRQLHRTGNKWIHLRDISDWLYEPENIGWLWLWLLIAWITFLVLRCKALFRLRPTCSIWNKCKYYIPIPVSIFLVCNQLSYKLAVAENENEEAVHSARFCYVLCAIDAFCLYKSRNIRVEKNTGRLFGQTTSDASKTFWDSIIHPLSTLIMVICLLGKPVVTILWLGIWIKEALLSEMIQLIFHYSGMHSSHKTFRYVLPLCSWLIYWTQGWVSFFQQGNSLSLSTVDLSAAYVGLRHHQPFIAGLLLAFYTYSGPLIWQLAYFCRFVLPGHKHFGEKFNCLVLGFIILPITLCGTYCFFLQSHLFIWTVFTPKMLYSAIFYVTLVPVLCLWAVITS